MDGNWFRHVNSFEEDTGWLHGIMRWDAKWGVLVFAGLLLVAWFIGRRSSDAPRRVAWAVWSALAALAAVALAQPINHTVQRQRPFVAMPGVHTLISHARDYGFPSDHATAVGAVAAGLWLVRKWLGALATLLALILAFSRVYVGVHYPGDAAGGLALGATVTLLGAFVAIPVLRRLILWIAHTPLRPIVAAPWARIDRY